MITAASIGFFHTLFGPDHYLPFIMMSRAKKWSLTKTAWITVLCGIGHVGSSVVLGAIGIILGIAVSKKVFSRSCRRNNTPQWIGDPIPWAMTFQSV
jgi:nickel/cobalt exporter